MGQGTSHYFIMCRCRCGSTVFKYSNIRYFLINLCNCLNKKLAHDVTAWLSLSICILMKMKIWIRPLSNLYSYSCLISVINSLTQPEQLSEVYWNLVPGLPGFTMIQWSDADHCVSAWSGSCPRWETVPLRADRDCSHKLGNIPPSMCPSLFQPLQQC